MPATYTSALQASHSPSRFIHRPFSTHACISLPSSQVKAAWSAACKGIPAVIANGKSPYSLLQIVSGQLVGTLFSQEGAQQLLQAGIGGPEAKEAPQTDAREAATRARAASRTLQALAPAQRVAVLHRVADALLEQQDAILAANVADVEAAEGRISESLLQRLKLKPAKLEQLADGTRWCLVTAVNTVLRGVLAPHVSNPFAVFLRVRCAVGMVVVSLLSLSICHTSVLLFLLFLFLLLWVHPSHNTNSVPTAPLSQHPTSPHITPNPRHS